MSFEEPNDPRSSEIVNNQIQLTELATYEERTPGHVPELTRMCKRTITKMVCSMLSYGIKHGGNWSQRLHVHLQGDAPQKPVNVYTGDKKD